MKKITLLLLVCLLSLAGHSQTDADSVQAKKEAADKIKMDKLMSTAVYPALNAGNRSGVIPVKDPTEIPDPTQDYKLLFELDKINIDSLTGKVNSDLVEIARIINLHVASGVPLKKIFPVIVVHGSGVNAVTNNEFYKEKFKTENPNIKLMNELVGLGAKFIACGQAMAFFEIKREALLPLVKVSVTAKTVFSNYQLKGYVKYDAP